MLHLITSMRDELFCWLALNNKDDFIRTKR